MAIARAFFDESGTNGEENLCVAGYVFGEQAAEQFDSEWKVMLAKYSLAHHHMREFKSQDGGPYMHLSWEDRLSSLQEAISIIQRNATCGFAFSIEQSSLADIVQDSPWTNGYAFLANQAFYGIEQLLRGREQGLVDFVYEGGAVGWEEALRVFNDAKSDPVLEQQLRLGTFEFVDKSQATQLQAADLLAWSWLRERRRVDKGERLGRHEEFRRLMTLPIEAHHWDAEAAKAIKWIRHKGPGDVDFLKWLTNGDTSGRFISWLMRSGDIALDYFRMVYTRERSQAVLMG